jgi:hypothetical protein
MKRHYTKYFGCVILVEFFLTSVACKIYIPSPFSACFLKRLLFSEATLQNLQLLLLAFCCFLQGTMLITCNLAHILDLIVAFPGGTGPMGNFPLNVFILKTMRCQLGRRCVGIPLSIPAAHSDASLPAGKGVKSHRSVLPQTSDSSSDPVHTQFQHKSELTDGPPYCNRMALPKQRSTYALVQRISEYCHKQALDSGHIRQCHGRHVFCMIALQPDS